MRNINDRLFCVGSMLAVVTTLIGGCPYASEAERLLEPADGPRLAQSSPRSFTLEVAVDGRGTVSPASGVFEQGSAVTIVAEPAPGWKFARWSGDVPEASTTENPVVVRIDRDMSLMGIFVVQCKLDVLVWGRGSVSPPGGLFDVGENLTLTAVAEPGYTFVQWEGALAGDENPTTIVMHADASVTAVFAAQCNLTAHVDGLGRVDPPSGTFALGAEVTLIADPEPGWDFVGWSGDVPAAHAADNPLTVVMDGDVDVTATFERGIVPGVGIGPIALGDRAADIDQALSAFRWSPDPSGPGIRFVYAELGLVGILADLDGDRRPAPFEPVILVGAMTPFTGTLDGIGIGSPQADVMEAMGPAEHILGNDLWYPSRGVVWTVEDGTVARVAVVPPFTPNDSDSNR